MMKNEVNEFLKWASDHKTYDFLFAMVSIDEGVLATLYNDTRGNPTIGVGRNLNSNSLSFDEIELMLNNDLKGLCYKIGTFNFSENLSHLRVAALANMIFNLGLTRFLRFKKMIAALEQKNYILAAAEIRNSKYWRDNDTHARAERIAKMIETDKMDPYYENY